ncbi:MAG: bi-domain-containing oxidoreductase [Desulfobulbaceae bacterium]|nr:bi-domain-containing oxidoreductase [Desulfobulbaceae bacterium]
MKQVLIRQGKAVVEAVPAPMVEAGTVLISLESSCLSAGTELSGLQHSGTPLWKRALKDPWKVKKTLELIVTRGFSHTTSVIRGELEAGAVTGYSAAGTVIGVGEGVDNFKKGDRVACAGAQCAHHAEIVRVPVNLVVPVPDPLDMFAASTVTLGAIAMQGVRRANPTLGETFVVVGLGVLGQLTVQLLKANGCRVIGTDLDENRIAIAQSMGMDAALRPGEGLDTGRVARVTDGVGADGVIVTAASPDTTLLSNSFLMCRRKGRVVLVGDVPIKIDRSVIYRKELDFFISTSYGPGRYDQRYEEEGLDYPVAYVRWTENRNMAEYLRLLADGRVNVEPLISKIYPLEQAGDAYESFQMLEVRPLILLLSYPEFEKETLENLIVNPNSPPLDSSVDKIRLALVGAGGFAKGMHLPNIKKLADLFQLQAVVSRSGHNAQAAATLYEAAYATTQYQRVLEDGNIDAVLIATRHNLHADMVLQALEAGKHVLVEKPLALNESELGRIANFFASRNTAPVLLTGFNRRFSPHLQCIKDVLVQRTNPLLIDYRMNAGHIPSDHWVHGPEGGGRNIGEACHIYDLFTALVDSRLVNVSAHAIRPATGHYRGDDNFVASMSFEDGSVANLTYTALGTSKFPKETMALFAEGMVLELDDFRQTRIHGAKINGVETRLPDKGQREELVAFAKAIRGEAEWPIPLWQQLQATRISFEVERLIGSACQGEDG